MALTPLTARAKPTRRAASAVALTIGLALALTGCAAGQRAQTASEYSVVDGASATIGQISIRDAGVQAPDSVSGYTTGSNAQLVMTIVNNSESSDQLVGVTTTISDDVVPSVSTGGDAPTSTATPSASSSASDAQTLASLVIPAGKAIKVGRGDNHDPILTMTNLKSALIAGTTVTVTFTFKQAGTTTVVLPVKLLANVTGGATVNVAPTGD
jgi:copper(I)-binding protein